MSRKRGFGDEDWFTKLEEQISGKDLARQLGAASDFIDDANRQQRLMDQITGAHRDASSGAAAVSRLASQNFLDQFNALEPHREREHELMEQIRGITAAQAKALSGACGAEKLTALAAREMDLHSNFFTREAERIAGAQAKALSGAYGAEKLTALAAREMDRHSNFFTSEAERISRMVSDSSQAFREKAERLANSYQENFHAIAGLSEQALRAVTIQPDWFNGAYEAAGMSVASLARNLVPDVAGIFSAKTLAYQLAQRSQESMLASLLKGIDPLQHASKAFELSTRHFRDLKISPAHEQVRAFVEGPAFEHMRSITAMIAEAMASGDEARARAAWHSAAEDDASSDVWRQVHAILYNLLRHLSQLRRRQKRKQSGKSTRAWLNENQGALSLIAIVVALAGSLGEYPIELGWQRLLSPVAASTTTPGQPVQLTYFRVTADDVRLRLGPSTKQRIVATVDRGNVVQRLGVCREWSQVALHTGRNDGKPVSGWIKSDYLKQLEKGVDPGTVSKPVVVDGCDE